MYKGTVEEEEKEKKKKYKIEYHQKVTGNTKLSLYSGVFDIRVYCSFV